MHGISDINWLFSKYYEGNDELRYIVMTHSEQVAKKALEICKHKDLPLNPFDVYCAALLHDIGVVKCNAPDINAKGISHYLMHGIEGKKILEEASLQNYANVCLTHVGTGITKEEIIKNNLPLPYHDMLPETLLEKLICYADKFYSKSGDLKREKSFDEVVASIKKHGEGSYKRFIHLHALFN